MNDEDMNKGYNDMISSFKQTKKASYSGLLLIILLLLVGLTIGYNVGYDKGLSQGLDYKDLGVKAVVNETISELLVIDECMFCDYRLID